MKSVHHRQCASCGRAFPLTTLMSRETTCHACQRKQAVAVMEARKDEACPVIPRPMSLLKGDVVATGPVFITIPKDAKVPADVPGKIDRVAESHPDGERVAMSFTAFGRGADGKAWCDALYRPDGGGMEHEYRIISDRHETWAHGGELGGIRINAGDVVTLQRDGTVRVKRVQTTDHAERRAGKSVEMLRQTMAGMREWSESTIDLPNGETRILRRGHVHWVFAKSPHECHTPICPVGDPDAVQKVHDAIYGKAEPYTITAKALDKPYTAPTEAVKQSSAWSDRDDKAYRTMIAQPSRPPLRSMHESAQQWCDRVGADLRVYGGDTCKTADESVVDGVRWDGDLAWSGAYKLHAFLSIDRPNMFVWFCNDQHGKTLAKGYEPTLLDARHAAVRAMREHEAKRMAAT